MAVCYLIATFLVVVFFKVLVVTWDNTSVNLTTEASTTNATMTACARKVSDQNVYFSSRFTIKACTAAVRPNRSSRTAAALLTKLRRPSAFAAVWLNQTLVNEACTIWSSHYLKWWEPSLMTSAYHLHTLSAMLANDWKIGMDST